MTQPPSVIAALTRPLWPPPVHEAPKPRPEVWAGPEYPEERETRLRSERQKEKRIGPIEHPVQQFHPEDADRAAVPQVYQYTANDAQFRTAVRGRTAVDGMRKHTILTLLGVGFSLRMTAGYVGVSHQTVANVLASDPAFAEDVRQARERAKVFPLNSILRECGRSWKAATWLLEYIERTQNDERSDADKHIERVRAKALAMIEKDLAKKMRKTAAKEGYHPWLAEEPKETAALGELVQTAAGAEAMKPPSR